MRASLRRPSSRFVGAGFTPARLSLAGLALLLFSAPAHAQAKVERAELEAAISKGRAWLEARQQPDGSFELPPVKTDTLETSFKMGYCALATLTLLKCGVPPGDPKIQKAFDHLYTLEMRRTYSVATLILAIEARYAPPKQALDEKKAYGTVVRKHFAKRANKADRKKLQECVNWLVTRRSKNYGGAGWRYPSDAAIDQDNSCTQYAMLAMKGARRLGANVPMEVFEKIADFMVVQQDPTGPEVEWFPVPAANGPIKDMLPIDKRKKLIAKEKKKEEKRVSKLSTRQREKHDTELTERRRMFARGWSYEPRDEQKQPPAEREGPVPTRAKGTNRSTGSMTCSGVITLCIAKSELENNPRAWRPRRDAVNTAISDGVAWLAKFFNPHENPTATGRTTGWKYYYLYSIERAGVLAGTYRFGGRDWWEEGAAHLIAQQQADGTWPEAKGLSSMSRTCFALLFLKRATVPLVPLPPKRVMTGQG